MFKGLIYSFYFILLLGVFLTSLADAADVRPQIYVSFDGSLEGTTYTLDPRELDTTGTFAAHNGTEIVSNGLGILTDADRISQESFQFDASEFNDNGEAFTNTAFVVEAIFTRTDDSAFMAPVIDIGGQCFIRFNNGLSAGNWNGTLETVNDNIQPIPDVGQTLHYAIVYDGANIIDYYVDGVRIFQSSNGSPQDMTRLVSWGNIRHTSVDGTRQLMGQYDSVAFSTFTGIFDPKADFILPGGPLARALTSNPKPANRATDVLQNTGLSWKPGRYADKHDVYLGTVFESVNNASRTSPLDVLVKQNYDANTYDPAGLLDFGQTYYWRVDEVNAPPDEAIFKGDVWRFTVEPLWYSIPGGNITASASSSEQEGSGPENTIDGSGLDANDLHSADSAAMWLSAMGVEEPVWLKYEFDKIYQLYEMWVWNYNAEFEDLLGFGLKDVTIEYSENGTDWTALGDFEFAQGPGLDGYAHNTTIDFGGLTAKYIRITANSHWGELPQYGLSEVRFFYRPVHARQPNPASGQTGVTLDAVLSWRAGREAVSHELYFSSDMQAVIDGTALVGTVSQNSYDLSSIDLELGKTYYWKINEVNEAESPASWEGDVWNFTTIEYLIVDDFEGYDDFCNRIFYTWIDGFGHSGDSACGVARSDGNGTGSTVGHVNPPFAERAIVHEGRQSMPFGYNNSAAPYYSEAQCRFDIAQDWTKEDVKTLTLYFYGDPGNAVGQIYVKLNDSKVVYDGDASKIQEASWNQWNIDLASFGVDLLDIRTLSIGVGNGTADGSGTLYIDDIRLY
jgi:hypothetical protein